MVGQKAYGTSKKVWQGMVVWQPLLPLGLTGAIPLTLKKARYGSTSQLLVGQGVSGNDRYGLRVV